MNTMIATISRTAPFSAPCAHTSASASLCGTSPFAGWAGWAGSEAVLGTGASAAVRDRAQGTRASVDARGLSYRGMTETTVVDAQQRTVAVKPIFAHTPGTAPWRPPA
ncbi:hypothetical protein [Nocardioides bruguierae]|uniref:hypothetical protein n=1 Tax=Nocardioides bruguierae TaxID=2945102 RepID=UPI0020202609|nr:hypothetical protein [Nocardioides bruguierae]MCL8024912.1 hypothetical protein [Nocardioides bruguierae]